MSVTSFLNRIWGNEQSRTFRFVSWGIAISAFSIYYYYEQKKPINEIEWNKKIKEKEEKEKKLKEIQN